LSTQLTKKKIFIFWLPLAATWLMMAFEGPFLAAIIARLAEPKYNLAAWGVAFSFALIIEAPIIMIMSASTALVENRQSFEKLRNFTYFINAAITLVMLVFLIPTIFNFISIDLIGLPTPVARLTHLATIILIPWPGAIGYRRFYQGILIRSNLTRRVAYGTVIRLISITSTALLLYIYSKFSGVIVAAIALSVGVLVEAVASRLMVYKTVRSLPQSNGDHVPLSYRQILHFYYPLALTSMLALGVHPLVAFFVGHSLMALESLAVLPVINSLVFIFRAMGLSYQEVAIALIGKKGEHYTSVRDFAFILGLSVMTILGFIAFTPLAGYWFGTLSGLTVDLVIFSIIPLQIMFIMPGLSVMLSFQRALQVSARETAHLTWATVLEVSGIIFVLFILTFYMNIVGAIAATSALLIGRIMANLYLVRPNQRGRQKLSG
jgi:uncharacterized membrane protein